MILTPRELKACAKMMPPAELTSFLIEMSKWEADWGTPEDTPDRHKDYLPLNLWDDTPDQ